MEDIIICRCQEVTEQEIIDAVHEGATTVDGIKRRTRACMGLCQGKDMRKAGRTHCSPRERPQRGRGHPTA